MVARALVRAGKPGGVAGAVVLAAVLVAGCSSDTGPRTRVPSTSPTTTAAESEAEAVRIVAAGDISCLPGATPNPVECQMEATAALAETLDPDIVLPLGDLQYELGQGPDFAAGYDRSWGRLKAVTRPVPGNHEYTGGKAAGYFGYFGDAAHGPDGWYSFDAGGWHVVVLNSVCAAVGGCDAGSPQYEWLRSDLDASESDCILAAWHHPRRSSGLHGGDDVMEPFWQLLAANGADLVLSGHDHHYERFAPSQGIVQIVAGTGGRSLYPVVRREEGSQAAQDRGFGVLELELSPGSYRTTFHPIPGFDFTDSSEGTCR